MSTNGIIFPFEKSPFRPSRPFSCPPDKFPFHKTRMINHLFSVPHLRLGLSLSGTKRQGYRDIYRGSLKTRLGRSEGFSFFWKEVWMRRYLMTFETGELWQVGNSCSQSETSSMTISSILGCLHPIYLQVTRNLIHTKGTKYIWDNYKVLVFSIEPTTSPIYTSKTNYWLHRNQLLSILFPIK